MRKLQRYYSVLLLALLAGLTDQALAKINVLACEPEWGALAQEIGREDVNVYTATTAYQDPHHIEPRPSLIARTRWADLLLCTGAELEVGWLPLLIRQSGNARIQQGAPGYFMATEQVSLLEKQEHADRSMGDIHAAGNPHIHLHPYRLLSVADQLATRLGMIDADNAQAYRENYRDFENRWQMAIENWENRARRLKGEKVVVQHRSWSYLLNWLGIEAVADLEPKPGLPPTSGHLASLLQLVEQHKPQAILVAAYQNDRGANWLSQRSDIPVVKLPYTVGGTAQANDLFSLYDNTLDILLGAPNEHE